MTNLPKAIQEQLNAAEALEKQMTGETPEAGNIEQPPVEAAPAPVSVTPEVQPQPAAQDETLKHKFDVLEGKYRAEVPRLAAQLREKDAQLQWALQQIEAMKGQKQGQPEQNVEVVTEKDVETFGDDMVKMVAGIAERAAAAAVARVVDDIRREVQPVKQRVEQVEAYSAKTEEERFFDKVRAAVSDWDSIENDPRWHQHLDSRAPGTVYTNRELAIAAVQKREIGPVVEMVKAWKQMSDIPPVPPQPTRQETARQELERQVSPSSQKSSSTPDAPKLWTMAEYERAYDPRNQANIGKGKWEELMAAADTALREGRVR